MRNRPRSAATLVALLAGTGLAMAVLGGCGARADRAGPVGAAPANGSTSADQTGGLSSKENKSLQLRRSEENMIAECMKKSGFRYEPYVPQSLLHPVRGEP